MADAGMRLLRILHFSPFAHRGYQGDGGHTAAHLAATPPERLIRQTDAIVQLAQKHGVVVFLVSTTGYPAPSAMPTLKAQQTWARFWVGRYKDIPGIIYDIQNEPNATPAGEPAVQGLWEAYLINRHGSLDAAWKGVGPAGQTPSPDPRPARHAPNELDDLHAVDCDRFKHHLLDRWLRANAGGIRDGDPDRLFTVGLLQWTLPAIRRLRRGPSLSAIAISMAVRTIWPRSSSSSTGAPTAKGSRSANSAASRCTTAARTAAMDHACARASTTISTSAITPSAGRWLHLQLVVQGLRRRDLPLGHPPRRQGQPVPKDVMLAYRNFSLLARQPEPMYRQPELAFLVPDAGRFAQPHN